MKENIMDKIERLGVVPVVVINDSTKAVALANAIIDGGIDCIEVTFRTDAAEESIKLIHEALPQMLVGAGTVITINQAERAVKAGASFIVSPGLDPDIVIWCQNHDIVVIPGVCSASEVQMGIKMGLKVLKFFPAEASGGVNMIKNLCGPFPQVKFMATGGISMDNITEYGSCPHVAAVGGSWMTKPAFIKEENWSAITKSCRDALKAVNGFELVHFGINTDSPDVAGKAASRFEVLGMESKTGAGSTFMDSSIEIMHTQFRGTHGHIGFRCYNIDRAVAYLSTQGFSPDENSAKYDDKGKLRFIYLNEDVEGFSIHLVRV